MPRTETNWDKRLDKVTEAKTNRLFIERLAKWLIDLSGNVNAAQRLNVIAFKIKEL